MNSPNTTSEYMLFFRGPDWDEGLSTSELEQAMSKVGAWFEGLQAQGKIKGGNPLARNGQIVSGRKGGSVTDGPFTESKEAVGGYLLLEADSMEEAVSIAERCPTLAYGITVEVRRVLEECPCFLRARARLAEALA
jgi:hypothetical protein